MINSGIYIIENKINEKFYIGSAVNITKRWGEHLFHLSKGSHKNKKLQNSFNKYGKLCFEFLIVETCLKEELIEREQYWIDVLSATKDGFNINPRAGNALGRKFPGRKLSEEHKRKLVASKIGKKRIFTESWKKKLSLAAQTPRPNQSVFMKLSWANRPSKRIGLECIVCGKSKSIVKSAIKKYGNIAEYKCRCCYLKRGCSK